MAKVRVGERFQFSQHIQGEVLEVGVLREEDGVSKRDGVRVKLLTPGHPAREELIPRSLFSGLRTVLETESRERAEQEMHEKARRLRAALGGSSQAKYEIFIRRLEQGGRAIQLTLSQDAFETLFRALLPQPEGPEEASALLQMLDASDSEPSGDGDARAERI